MRTSFSTLAIMASSLLVNEVLAAPVMQRDYFLDVDTVVVTEEVCVTALADGSYATGDPKAVGTAFIDGQPVLVKEPKTTPPSPPPAQTPAPETPERPAKLEVPATPTPSLPPTPTPEPIVPIPSTPPPEPTPKGGYEAKFLEQNPATTPVSTIPTPSPVPTTPSTGGSGSGKRGLAYNDATLLQPFIISEKITWAYSWGARMEALPANIEFVPMLWGAREVDTNGFPEAIEKALAAGSTYILGPNEPDHPDQANLLPAAAAAAYMQWMQPYAGRAKLVSPAVTNGPGDMGLTYLKRFLEACWTCTIDVVAIHWYRGGTVEAFIAHIERAYEVGGRRPIWVTEFEAPGSGAEQAAFLEEVMRWMDETEYVERYAYFMVSEGSLVNGQALSSLGSTYAMST